MVDLKQLAGQTIALMVVTTLALFLPAGTLVWPVGWVFLGLFFGFFIAVNFWLLRHNPGLLQERMHFAAADQQGWDKLLFPLLALFPLIWLGFIALDAARFHWSTIAPDIQGAGAVVLLLSFYLFFLTFRENAYLSPVVRIQAERGHSVISTGPYHYVRHPMYTGIIAFMVGTSLLLGSWYGILVGMILVILLARRAVLEEHMLRRELRDYADYMTRVKYRFVPHIW